MVNKKLTNGDLGMTYIDGMPWAVRLPDGGAYRKDVENSEFNQILNLVGKDAFHCDVASWCGNRAHETRFDEDESCYWYADGFVVRYDHDPISWDIQPEHYRGYGTGFRPVLTPLNPNTLSPDTSRLSEIKDGTILTLGTLYMNGQALDNPTNPIGSGQLSGGMFGAPLGNIPRHIKGSSFEIGDTADDASKQIRFIKFGNNLIADRVILAAVSMDDLSSNFVTKDISVSHSYADKFKDNGPITLSGRLGITLDVTPQELDILSSHDRKEAQTLLAQLILTDRCRMSGDTYFPYDWNEEIYEGYEDELSFDLPDGPLHEGFQSLMPHKTTGLDSLISAAKKVFDEQTPSKNPSINNLEM